MDKAQLVEIANTEMPFGKYKGRRLIDVPEEYLLWFARKDQVPAGPSRRADGVDPADKTEGLSDLVQPRRKRVKLWRRWPFSARRASVCCL